MSSRWPCNEKRQSTEHQDDNNGLCVASLEFPILLPKDNTLNAQRDFSSSQQIPTEKEVQHKNIQSLDQSAVVDNSHTTAKPDEDYSNQETTIDSQGPEVYVRQEGKSDILDRRWFGWTWRRWLFILGPATAIVVVAIVLVAVFVTRSRTESANTVSIPGTPPNDPLPSDPSATFNGTFNGTSVTSAYPDSSNGSLWIFYQDYAGNLVYTPLGPDGSWGSLVRLQTPKGVLKGTVLTALNWESDLRINLIYQDSSGNLRNFLYNSRKQLFSDGRVDEFQIPVSTASHMVKPFSYYDDGTGYRYIYYTGPDGLIYEYTANIDKMSLTRSYIFPRSNGYSGCTVLFDQANSIVTMYLINHDNQMQMYWRDWIYSGNVPQHQWTQGDVIPSAAKPLGFELNPNSTLSLAQTTANSIFAQEAKTGNIWRVSWEGLGANQRWTKAVSTNATAQPNSVMHTQSMYASDLAHNLTHAFVQQNGNDITHLILQGDGTFTVRDRIPT